MAVSSALVVAACLTPPPPQSVTPPPSNASVDGMPVRHFAGTGISFDYPATWTAARFDVTSSFSNSLVYLSTSALSDPCVRGSNSVACGWAATSALGRDGLLVEWAGHGFPGWTFDPTKGGGTNVAGRAATVEAFDATDACRAIGGDSEIVVTIDDPRADWNWTELRACLRGPNVDGLRAKIDAMLRSVRWTEGG